MDAKNLKDNRKDDKSTINSSSPKDSKPVASKSTEKPGISSMKDSKKIQPKSNILK